MTRRMTRRRMPFAALSLDHLSSAASLQPLRGASPYSSSTTASLPLTTTTRHVSPHGQRYRTAPSPRKRCRRRCRPRRVPTPQSH